MRILSNIIIIVTFGITYYVTKGKSPRRLQKSLIYKGWIYYINQKLKSLTKIFFLVGVYEMWRLKITKQKILSAR